MGDAFEVHRAVHPPGGDHLHVGGLLWGVVLPDADPEDDARRTGLCPLGGHGNGPDCPAGGDTAQGAVGCSGHHRAFAHCGRCADYQPLLEVGITLKGAQQTNEGKAGEKIFSFFLAPRKKIIYICTPIGDESVVYGGCSSVG